MNLISRQNPDSGNDMSKMPGFTADLHRTACRLVLDLQQSEALQTVGDKISTAETYPEVVEALSDAKVRLRLKKITSEVPKFD